MCEKQIVSKHVNVQVQEWRDLHDLVIGRPPPACETATDEQLIALAHKMKTNRGPYVNLAVWVPFWRPYGETDAHRRPDLRREHVHRPSSARATLL